MYIYIYIYTYNNHNNNNYYYCYWSYHVYCAFGRGHPAEQLPRLPIGFYYYSFLLTKATLLNNSLGCLPLFLAAYLTSEFGEANWRILFTFPLSQDFFTIPVRQSSLLFLSQMISLLFQSDKGVKPVLFRGSRAKHDPTAKTYPSDSFQIMYGTFLPHFGVRRGGALL